ncbi:PilC/PilY family type IV pilus protein [Aquitalea sp.]|uniref:pilus assembly protein n=1 Tax=Aquitalea sp. TaxID=1872623 RepID=UPI0025893312|nr:PilC/PilY family type IV pilus protein [Aquitalea sp.]
MKNRLSISGLIILLLWVPVALAASSVSIGSLPLAGIGSSYGPNVMFALSVEFPTAGSAFSTKTAISSVADLDVSGATNGNTPFLGYFDYAKCYKYTGSGSTGYFTPYSSATLTSVTYNSTVYKIYTCDGTAWSGNLLNWATMSAIDIFRATLTGGNRALGTGGWSTSSGNTTAATLVSDYSAGDGASLTYLRRAAVVPGQNQGYNLTGKPVSGLTVSSVNYLAKITPYGTSYTNLWFSNGPNYGSGSHPWSVSIYRNSSNSQPSSPYEIDNAIAKVCVSGMVEDGTTTPYTCKQYGSNYKPEGLIQTNGSKMRFGAASYLVNTQYTQDGGALRARLKYPGISQSVTGNSGSTYTLGAEWGSDGTFVVNPDANDAVAHTISSTDTSTTYGSTAAVSNSGVVNYLNKFGDTIASNIGYKQYDPAAHLYYAALRYFRNYGNYSTFTSSLSSNTSWQGGFPAITDWDDPILNSCQKNFVIYIGDTNTHNDIDLPGSAWSGAVVPTDDTAFNIATWTKNLGSDEGMTGTQYQTVNTGSTNSPPYIAGLAWWANTNNIRTKSGDTKTATVSSFMIDVVEGGNYKGVGDSPCSSYWSSNVCNAFFMAAKYGGFTDSNSNAWPDLSKEWASAASTTTGTTGSTSISTFPSPATGYTGTPTNYAPANNPAAMVSALNNALSSISGSANASQAGLGASSGSRVYTPGTYVFQPAFNSTDWSGDLIANTVSIVTSASGAVSPVYTPAWQAKLKLETQLNSSVTARNVLTYDYTAMAGAAFNTTWYSALSSKTDVPTGTTSFQYTGLNAGGYGTYRVNYLRGDKTQEGSSTSPQFRTRNYRMGDVVHSTPVYIPTPTSDPSGCSFDANLSSPATDRATIFARPAAMAVAANDGFLHIFNASYGSSTVGNELAAFLPASIYANLPNLSSTTYTHQFFNDGSPVYKDVCFLYGSNGAALSSPEARSVVVGTTGAGGTSVYALDVTHVDSMGSSNVLWEFSSKDDAKLGYTIGSPVITKLSNGRPVVIFGNGYNQSSGTTASLFVLYLDKRSGVAWTQGTNYFRIDLPAPTLLNTSPNGLSAPGIIISNGAVKVAYAGDLNGNLWKFDLSSTTPSSWVAPTAPLFTACSSYTVSSPTTPLTQCTASTIQPITTGTYVTRDPLRGYMVLFGTGQYLSGNDLNQTNTQTLYGIRDDGLLSAKNTLTASLLAQKVGSLVTTTTSNGITSSYYSIINDSTNTASSCSGAVNYLPYGCNGWFLSLSTSGFTSGREVATPYIYQNTLVYFTVAFPSSTSICGSGGATVNFGLNYATGAGTASAIFDTSGNGTMNSADLIANAMWNNGISMGRPLIIKISNVTYMCSIGSSGVISCTAIPDNTSAYGRLSWREIIQSW